jgi:hypothetical protein
VEAGGAPGGLVEPEPPPAPGLPPVPVPDTGAEPASTAGAGPPDVVVVAFEEIATPVPTEAQVQVAGQSESISHLITLAWQ